MASVSIPSGIVWAFNPTYIQITGVSAASKAVVSVGNNSISVNLVSGSNDILISRLIQLAFDSPRTTRSKALSINVTGGVSGSGNVTAIWGCVGYADKYYQFTDNGTTTRTVQRFINYPFAIDVLTNSGFNTISNIAATSYEYVSPAGTITTIIVDRPEREGAYLRWVDRFGFIQYYLFVKGSKQFKSSSSEHSIEELTSIVSTSYAQHERPLQVSTEQTFKLCAVNLDKSTLEYVSSIVGSPIVDLYLGDNKWLPVRVEDGTYTYSEHHLKHIQDFEITILLPKRNSQSL